MAEEDLSGVIIEDYHVIKPIGNIELISLIK